MERCARSDRLSVFVSSCKRKELLLKKESFWDFKYKHFVLTNLENPFKRDFSTELLASKLNRLDGGVSLVPRIHHGLYVTILTNNILRSLLA